MTATIIAPDTVAELVGDAVTAPSMHNAQPWKFVFSPDGNVIELHGDLDRAMTRTDPNHRALHLGCAAALFNLRVSAVHHGLRARVQLLPDDSRPWLLATAAIDGPSDEDHELAALHAALRRRHTSRFPFSDEPVPDALVDGLKGAARLEGCRLAVPGDWHIETVLGLVRDAEHREDIDPLVREETSAWTSDAHAPTGTRRDGIPAAAFGPRSSGGPSPVRDFGRDHPAADRGWAVFEKRPQLALLGTQTDTRVDWLRAGQALERVLLQATSDGLATSMTSQPLEWPELRWTVRDPVEVMGHVQMVLRLGYGPHGPETPRRPVADVLEIRE
ncbi:Acg family FMN-binding oxidoreductase [Streptomyces sp. NBC_00162]|uniref:Acg family FMN-binding oxidoreductase n=1 Tax=Streptomyces sp. NBC_00162 TaxID=2903629 RepID=UPI00214B8CC5|nr:nitroreductase family protein [Streptomyces sp. NBC_00162]UUU38663.1 nitroreductase family protein [Streptomyces sp. NBC_00162]